MNDDDVLSNQRIRSGCRIFWLRLIDRDDSIVRGIVVLNVV